ncbi:hypothetical protein [Corallococcus terminator]|uniref:Uncharacterized protein n=1 Tax=Corallococcus terminator TaxID=2316733 RepID=A0A3A8HPK8_9BACT|nr:hypothetical protein [Corallococcus terminator]RKG67811.1 hypothetical protein D7V88_40945 [Corallococcus terminator]
MTKPVNDGGDGQQRVDSFAKLPHVVQADGWIVLPVQYITKDASVLTDRQFWTSMGLLLELEAGPWEPSLLRPRIF